MHFSLLPLPIAVKKAIRSHDAVRIRLTLESAGKFFAIVDNTAQELALFFADYRCERCGSEEDLTFHHLIRKIEKPYMAFEKYLHQRHDFRNSVILCMKCHGDADGIKEYWKNHYIISRERIAEVMMVFGKLEKVG